MGYYPLIVTTQQAESTSTTSNATVQRAAIKAQSEAVAGYNEALPIVLFNEAGQQLANLQTGDYTFTAQAGEVVKVKLAFNTVLTSAEQFSNSFLRVAIDGNNLSVSGLGQGRSDVQLLSISGQLLQSHQPVGDALQVSNLNRGVYLLRVKDSNGLLGVRKVVIQ